MSTLAQEMYKEYVQKVKDEELRKNIEDALEDNKESMRCHEDECILLMDWQDLPDDWVALPETIDYLRENGFTVEITDDGRWGERRVAHVKWPTDNTQTEEI